MNNGPSREKQSPVGDLSVIEQSEFWPKFGIGTGTSHGPRKEELLEHTEGEQPEVEETGSSGGRWWSAEEEVMGREGKKDQQQGWTNRPPN